MHFRIVAGFIFPKGFQNPQKEVSALSVKIYCVNFLFLLFFFSHNLNLDLGGHVAEIADSCGVGADLFDHVLELDELAVNLVTELLKSLGAVSYTHLTLPTKA